MPLLSNTEFLSSLAFPKTDIEEAYFYLEDNVVRAKFVINSINLFGAGSPLPAHYYESIACDDEQGRRVRDFLDLFNQRLQALIYPIWKKYRMLAGSGYTPPDDPMPR